MYNMSTGATQDDSQHELVRKSMTLQTESGLGESPGLNDERPSILSDPKKEKNFDTRPNDLSNPPGSNKNLGVKGGSRRKKYKSSRIARKSRTTSTRRRRRHSNRRRRTARK
jgi:hypothetical protein